MTLAPHFAALLLLCFGSTLVFAEDTKSSAAPGSTQKSTETGEKTASKDPRTEVTCTNEPITGSRLPRRVCHSREEREMMQRAGRETVGRIQEMPIPKKGE